MNIRGDLPHTLAGHGVRGVESLNGLPSVACWVLKAFGSGLLAQRPQIQNNFKNDTHAFSVGQIKMFRVLDVGAEYSVQDAFTICTVSNRKKPPPQRSRNSIKPRARCRQTDGRLRQLLI
jgi:hypothetical protein